MHLWSGVTQWEWPKALWKSIRNGTLEVVVAIVVVLIAAWFLVDSAPEQRMPVVPVPFAYK